MRAGGRAAATAWVLDRLARVGDPSVYLGRRRDDDPGGLVAAEGGVTVGGYARAGGPARARADDLGLVVDDATTGARIAQLWPSVLPMRMKSPRRSTP